MCWRKCFITDVSQRFKYVSEGRHKKLLLNSTTVNCFSIQTFQMDKYYETSWERVIACVPFLTIYHEFRVQKLKNSKTFFTLWFGQQRKDIVLQTNFFTSSLNLNRDIFVCTNSRECWDLDISRGFIFAIKRQNTPKNLEPYFDHVQFVLRKT